MDMVTIFYWFIGAVVLLLVLALLYRITYKLWNWFKTVRSRPLNRD
ncbi:MAG TPA: hypothetical protein VGR15_05415 [Bacteroidota bacterium]|nr:hypothetical protein [Bacteroidota bacterium]